MTEDQSQLLGELKSSIAHLEAKMDRMEASVDALTAQANRFKGAFILALALGGTIGWIADKVFALWSKAH